MLPGNLTVLLGIGEHLFKEPLHLGARARAGTTGNRSAKSNENSVLTATAELRTYKINLLGKSKWRIVIPGNGFDREKPTTHGPPTITQENEKTLQFGKGEGSRARLHHGATAPLRPVVAIRTRGSNTKPA